MTSALAFLPWMFVRSARTVGSVRLIPYVRSSLPGNQPSISQADIDAILSAYTDFQGRPIQKATLLEVGKWISGEDPSRYLGKLFNAQRMLAFAALSDRVLFQAHFDYCNTHNYELVVQAFTPGNVRSVALQSRRRDGNSRILWSSNVPAFRRPLHVASGEMSVDEPLLRSLLSLGKKDAALKEAVVDFIGGNTDSPDIPWTAEVVMMKAAFEWLYRIDHQAESLVKAVRTALPPPSSTKGPLSAKWYARYRKQHELPASWRPIIGWVREFCMLRNASAHGKQRTVRKAVWRPSAHLAFASVAFPLLLKQELVRLGRYALTEEDTAKLGVIDQFVLCDPMRQRATGRHPWHDIETSAILGISVRKMFQLLKD